MFCLSDHKACGILAPQSRLEPTSPALEGQILTTGLPGTSHLFILFFFFPSIHSYFYCHHHCCSLLVLHPLRANKKKPSSFARNIVNHCSCPGTRSSSLAGPASSPLGETRDLWDGVQQGSLGAGPPGAKQAVPLGRARLGFRLSSCVVVTSSFFCSQKSLGLGDKISGFSCGKSSAFGIRQNWVRMPVPPLQSVQP